MTQTAVEFADAVASTIQGVTRLYRELDQLHESLLDALGTDPDPFRFLLGTPLDPSNRDELDRRIRDQYHVLLEPGAPDEDALGVDDDNADDNGVSKNERRMRHKATFEPETPYLAISVILYDPVRPVQEPHIRYMVLHDWAAGASKSPRDGGITVMRPVGIRMLRKMDLSDDHDPKRRIMTAAKAQGRGGRQAETVVSVRLPLPPRTVPIYSLEGIEAIDRLAQDIKAYWREATHNL